MLYEDLHLIASPKLFYEDPRLAIFICTMLKISCKHFFRSLYNCLINTGFKSRRERFDILYVLNQKPIFNYVFDIKSDYELFCSTSLQGCIFFFFFFSYKVVSNSIQGLIIVKYYVPYFMIFV